jgi:hypothetical protein
VLAGMGIEVLRGDARRRGWFGHRVELWSVAAKGGVLYHSVTGCWVNWDGGRFDVLGEGCGRTRLGQSKLATGTNSRDKIG